MTSYNAEKVLQSLSVDCSHYESTEEWDKLDNVMELYKWVKNNVVDGVVYLTEQQKEVYLTGECNDVKTYETFADLY